MSKIVNKQPYRLFVAGVLMMAFLMPSVAYAQYIENFIDVATAILIKIVPILLGLSLLVFFWGLIKFIHNADDEKTHEEGKQLMIWGLVAILVMVSIWAIIGWLQYQFGINSAPPMTTLWSQPNTIPSIP